MFLIIYSVDKVGCKLVCLFVEKLLSFKKVCGRGPKGPQKNRPVMPKSAVRLVFVLNLSGSPGFYHRNQNQREALFLFPLRRFRLKKSAIFAQIQIKKLSSKGKRVYNNE